MGPFPRSKFLLLSLGLLLLFFIFGLYWFLFVPPSKTALAKLIFVKKGTHLKKVSEILNQEGVIKNRHFFILLTTVLGKKAKIKAGEYEFHTQMLPLEVLDALVKGQVKHHLVTIPEGYTLSQIAQLLEDLNLVDKKGFLQKASSSAFINALGLSQFAGPNLEGYLFPDTYHLFREMDSEEVIQMMVYQFKKVFGPDLVNQASELGISEKEVVILASIIEKETPLPEEKPLISAVFHNRLKRKIPLQSDPTVIYGIKNFNGKLTKEHLMRPTPYNTYLIAGLPPTPICNPGKDSLLAAVRPAPVPYLYFVSKNDGSHFFSSDIEEHNRAVWKYQKYPRKNNLTKK
jgi:peptidoglycan lytic transglycosylase G